MNTVHILVEAGEDKGKEIHVTPEGIRLGRSSKNDVVLIDPLLSRHHCRIYFKPDAGLTITDLGSSNTTLVNGKEVMEMQLQHGDIIQVGDTVMKVVNDGKTPDVKVSSAAAVDLGLSPAPAASSKSPAKKIGTGPLIIAACIVIAIALAVWMPKLLNRTPESGVVPVPHQQPSKKTLAVEYEKVEADSDNIFRYKLTITEKNDISIEIDDLANDRTLRKEKSIEDELIKDLIRYIENTDFFTLRPDYVGVNPDIFDQKELTITIDRKTHTSRVLNRHEPETFKDLREKLEVFGKNELGLWSIQFSTEKLIEMAKDEYLLGKKLYDEREVKYGNLAEALKNFQKAEMDLETVEPKPDFYADTISSLRECKQMLHEKYEALSFEADRASKLQEWQRAADVLREIQERIPDRSDERNRQARRELLDVEERLKANK